MVQRHTFPSGVTALVSAAMERDGFVVAFTERGGGASDSPFRGLNLGLKTGDQPTLVHRNRRLACDALGIEAFACLHQVHGATCVRVGPRRAGVGFTGPPQVARADAMTTRSPGVALAVLTADCVPVALADPGPGRLAVVHAGWRGIASGVVDTALGTFDRPSRLLAAVGPAIGPDHYEVGPEVVEAVSRVTRRGAVVRPRPGGRPHLDLARTITRILRERGVRWVERSEVCTACEAERFYSYRRDGITGRQALVAMRR